MGMTVAKVETGRIRGGHAASTIGGTHRRTRGVRRPGPAARTIIPCSRNIQGSIMHGLKQRQLTPDLNRTVNQPSAEPLQGVLDSVGDAEALANRLGQPLLASPPANGGLMLQFRNGRLCLVDTTAGGPGPVCVDFADRRIQHRLRRATPGREAVARAVGLAGRPGLEVVDATGGLGMDGFVLAALGARVTILERHPVVYELLHDGWLRALDDPATASTAHRMKPVHADARAWLARRAQPPDAIYLDPMYPAQTKGGEVKKGMRSLQRLLGADEAVESLFEAAWNCQPQRLVIKRPRRAPVWRGEMRKFSLDGRHTRFDVYLVAEASEFSPTT